MPNLRMFIYHARVWLNLALTSQLRGLHYFLLYALIYLIQTIFKLKVILPSPYGKLYCPNTAVTRATAYEVVKVCFLDYLKMSDLLIKKYKIDTVIDIGANEGGYSLCIATNYKLPVFAIEPVPINYRNILINASLNKLSQLISVLPVACGNYNGKALMDVNSISNAFLTSSREGIEVTIRKFDSIINTLLKSHKMSSILVKIDVQGSELQVLRGMRKSLSSRIIKALIIEVHEYRGVTTTMIESFLRQYGYRLLAKLPYPFKWQPHLYFGLRSGNE